MRGQAEHVIPQYVADHQIDILVMGTVARTGISGFFIGNTAENVVQKLECSLLALKPNGFVSPVMAY
ncbi:universal stress protein [Aeromonas salmonicida]|uniref:universal stress protein n=1 Tax=Aeromonas salmonicida TaxID=645 RepID=UPI00370D59A1